jgi:hypothetical protein
VSLHTLRGAEIVPAAKRKMIDIENVIRPGHVYQVDAEKYEAMKAAFLKIVPKAVPGATPAEILKRVVAHLPERLYPGGATAGWWMKAVQLDLEAKGIIEREAKPPVRLHLSSRRRGR